MHDVCNLVTVLIWLNDYIFPMGTKTLNKSQKDQIENQSEKARIGFTWSIFFHFSFFLLFCDDCFIYGFLRVSLVFSVIWYPFIHLYISLIVFFSVVLIKR